MAKIVSISPKLSTDEKWEKIKPIYEQRYKVKFKKKLSEDQIDFLFKKIQELDKNIAYYFFQKPDLEKRFLQHCESQAAKEITIPPLVS